MILLRELMEVIAYALDVEVVDVDSSMESLEEWDSLGHLSILTAIDKKLEGRASTLSELASATSVASIISALEKNSLIDK